MSKWWWDGKLPSLCFCTLVCRRKTVLTKSFNEIDCNNICIFWFVGLCGVVKWSKHMLRMKRLALLLFTERRCSSQLMGIFSFRQGLARKRKMMKIILIVKIWIADFRLWRKHELFLWDDHATKICVVFCFFFCCRSQPGVYQVCLFKSFFKRQRPPWLLGRSNFLCNKSHIVGCGSPSINTGSVFLRWVATLLPTSINPIWCLVTVFPLKTDSSLRNLQAERGYVGKSTTYAPRTSTRSLYSVSTFTQAVLVRFAL